MVARLHIYFNIIKCIELHSFYVYVRLTMPSASKQEQNYYIFIQKFCLILIFMKTKLFDSSEILESEKFDYTNSVFHDWFG